MEKKQSSVEQVFSHIKASRNDIQYWNDSMLVDWLLEQEYRLKAMHKEEMIQFAIKCMFNSDDISSNLKNYFIQKYNETFGGEQC